MRGVHRNSGAPTLGGAQRGRVADALFEHPRLAAVYDALEPDRDDLDAYADLITELGAQRVLDVGCGTGTFAVALAGRNVDVVALDPALASLHVARGKPGAERVRWVHGDATALPADLEGVDLAVMTGVAQAIVDEQEWAVTLSAVRRCLRPGGHLVLENRRLERRAWQGWTRERTEAVTGVPRHGSVRHWQQLVDVDLPLVTSASVRAFDDETLTSPSTLRLRGRDEIVVSLTAAGYVVDEIREAPDRPGHRAGLGGVQPSSLSGREGVVVGRSSSAS